MTQEDDEHQPPRSDLKDAIAWLVFGMAVVIASVRMDRLEQQNINPYTVPGLLPGLLGAAMVLLGIVLFIRSWERGALRDPAVPATQHQREERKRVGIAVLLCIGYSVVLVGHGIPFWIASTIYITVSILVFQRMSGHEHERTLTPRRWVMALVIAVSASIITWLAFEKLFLVRLP